jgi:uncharacterized protein YdiU (UPF0061 family)
MQQARFMSLGPSFFTPLQPKGLPQPYWVARSLQAGQLIDWPVAKLAQDETLQALAGNRLPAGSHPFASVYSGHQFGHWAGQLGDGRAHVLGEWNGYELQLKGAGDTPFSRMGDGRAVLRSSIREFLASEAMAALGVPTTRALSVVGSDMGVQREQVETAAVVTRLAPSFIRFGHFEHFSARQQLGELRQLADFVIAHHYPGCASGEGFQGNRYAALLAAVAQRTAELLAHWQALGFCHGVMNTDNMSILGLTLDYGPFQFLDAFDPGHICNHSDNQGRYAFERQPDVANWNLFCLGQALLPLIEDTEPAMQALQAYKERFETHFLHLMLGKLGLRQDTEPQQAPDTADVQLLLEVMNLLTADRVDYTLFWRRLSHAVHDGVLTPVIDLFVDRSGIQSWLASYKQRRQGMDAEATGQAMLARNPKFVLRNYMGEEAIRAAQAKDYSVLLALQTVLQAPFEEHPQHEAWAGLPPDWSRHIAISCSS